MVPTSANPHGLETRTLTLHVLRAESNGLAYYPKTQSQRLGPLTVKEGLYRNARLLDQSADALGKLGIPDELKPMCRGLTWTRSRPSTVSEWKNWVQAKSQQFYSTGKLMVLQDENLYTVVQMVNLTFDSNKSTARDVAVSDGSANTWTLQIPWHTAI